jgi:lysozyme family protein
MTPSEYVRREIKKVLGALERRHASTADDAERPVLQKVIDELEKDASLRKAASPLETADAIANVTAALERAIAAARLGPFDGHLTVVESTLSRLNRLSGKLHRKDRLASAAVKSRASGKGRKRAAVQASRAAASLESLDTGVLTSTTFADLKDEYQHCFDRCTIRPEFAGTVAYYLKRLKQGRPTYQLVERELGVPWAFVGVIHAMECGFNFAGHMHNGDPLTARTVQVPKGHPKVGTPPFTWLQSALDALRLKKFDQIGDWSVPHMLYRGLISPYLWSFSNLYSKGKFVKDGKFDPEAVSKQCGAGLMLKAALAT